MLLFGHIGITLAAALIFKDVLPKNRSLTLPEISSSTNSGKISSLNFLSAKYWGLIKKTRGLDLRAVIIGSLLPDIIDKPIGNIFFRDIFGNGILFSHTLLFVLVITLCGWFFNIVYKKSFVLLLAFGCFIHLFLDGIFLHPRIFLWPAFGFTFEQTISLPFLDWLLVMIAELWQTPWISIPELIGMIITVWFVYLLWRQKRMRSFISKGQI